jgi:hypothetical protein
MNCDHITSALHAAEVQSEILDSVERRALVIRLRERLGIDVTAHAPWDDNAAPEGQLRSDGWELIPAYVGNSVCLMFLDGAKTIWKFNGGTELRRVLEECPALEFYVCDQEASYLICSNHHDYLIGWGTATQWVDRLGPVNTI